MKKSTPWLKIKAEYLAGVTPRELAFKYKIRAKTITDKFSKEKLTDKKRQIATKIEEEVIIDIQEEIKSLINLSLPTLRGIITNPETKDSDKINAIKVVVDISGLKTQENKLTVPIRNILGLEID